MASKQKGRVAKCGGGIPDLQWINRNIAVVDIAKALDLRLDGCSKIHCWHPERHQHGDRTASVGIRRKTNTAKCFGCDSKPMGPVDLVMDVLGVSSPLDAALWIAERFSVVRIPKGTHLKQPPRSFARAGFEGDIGILVYSGLWTELSWCTRAIVPVLLSFGEREEGKTTAKVKMSYGAISRYSGVKSPNAVSKAIGELEELQWLERKRAPGQPGDIVRGVSTYLITPQCDGVTELAHMRAKQTRDAIAAERELRKVQRTRRIATLQQAPTVKVADRLPRGTGCTKYESLYSVNSTAQVAASRGEAGNHGNDVCKGSSEELIEDRGHNAEKMYRV